MYAIVLRCGGQRRMARNYVCTFWLKLKNWARWWWMGLAMAIFLWYAYAPVMDSDWAHKLNAYIAHVVRIWFDYKCARLYPQYMRGGEKETHSEAFSQTKPKKKTTFLVFFKWHHNDNNNHFARAFHLFIVIIIRCVLGCFNFIIAVICCWDSLAGPFAHTISTRFFVLLVLNFSTTTKQHQHQRTTTS